MGTQTDKIKPSIIVVGDTHEAMEQLKGVIKKRLGAYIFKTLTADEIDQIGKQSGNKVALLFTDPQFCINYVDKHREEIKDINYKVYLVIGKNGKFKEETEKVFKKKDIHLFFPKNFDALITDLKVFYEGKESDGGIPELEFNID